MTKPIKTGLSSHPSTVEDEDYTRTEATLQLQEARSLFHSGTALHRDKLQICGVATERAKRGNVYLFIDFWPKDQLLVNRDSEVSALCCGGRLQDGKPVEWKGDSATVGQVKKQMYRVEPHVHRGFFHLRPLMRSS